MNNEMPEVLYIRPTHSDGKHFSCSLQSDTLKRTKYVRADKAVTKWYPIETAPQSGERILLYSPKRWTKRGKQHTLRYPYISIGFWNSNTALDENISAHRHELIMKHGGYWSNHFKGEKPLEGLPTHWMPLPQPPKEGD